MTIPQLRTPIEAYAEAWQRACQCLDMYERGIEEVDVEEVISTLKGLRILYGDLTKATPLGVINPPSRCSTNGNPRT